MFLEALIQTFGRVLEPYIVKVIQSIMLFIGDPAEEIRELSLSAIKALMRHLSGFGVKIVLPFLLVGKKLKKWFFSIEYIQSF